MSSYALWVDHKHAYVYKFTTEGVDEEIIKSENENANSHHDLDKFFHTIAQKLGDPKELMIMGPGMAKEEFKNHCEKHHHKQLASAIVGVRPMAGHPTKALMVEEAREFFKHLHLWTKNY